MAASTRLDGKEETLRRLGAAVDAIDHPKPLFEKVGDILLTSTDMRFESQSDPDGNPWPPSLRALTEGGTTLTDKGQLRDRMEKEASDEGVAVGTNVIYAAIHQMGGTIHAKSSKGLRFRAGGNGGWVTKMSVNIPQRAFLGVSESNSEEIEALAVVWLARAAGEAGGADAR
jgi:phage virion morphogenesis protein